MKEYIRLEEKNAPQHGKVYNWETAKYGKIWYDKDVYDLRSVETKFPAIVLNDELSSEKTLSCEPTISSLNNNEIDFRISFDESDDEDYTVIFDKNLFSYKIITINDLKMDSKSDNEKVNMPSFLLPEPTVSCFDDLDFFKDFENEFPAIVYNDALMSKSDFLTEPTLSPQHIDEFDLKDETSLSKYDESDKDNNDDEIDIIQSSRDTALPPRDQRHHYVRYEGLQYIDDDIANFETRLGKIYMRDVHRVHIFDFGGLTDLMAEGLSSRMLMEHKDAQGQSVFTNRAWKRLFEIRGPLVHEFILEFFSTFRFGEADPMLRLCHRLIACSIAGRSQTPEKVTVTDLFYLIGTDVGSVNVPYLLARYLRLFASGRKQGAMISRGQFVARLGEKFRLVTEERLQGLTVIVRDLLVIDMAELVRLQICIELDDTWDWVALGPERQQIIAAGAPEATEDAPVVDEGALAVSAPV
nr:hypothetical protein [Tanacetum cinerariifolium]